MITGTNQRLMMIRAMKAKTMIITLDFYVGPTV